jgi:tetratricopeptide (TPR) repeat protein
MQRLLAGLAAALLVSVYSNPILAAGGGGGGDMGGAGGGGGRGGTTDRVAAKRFERAKQHCEEAKELEDKLETTTDADDREDLEDDIRDHYEDAVDDLEYVVRKQPKSYPARSQLGFALRKLGKFDASLEAYDGALEIKPSYAPAIEYRGEAYLELGRLSDARGAWEKLNEIDTELADMLLGKMQRWLARQQAGGKSAASPEALTEFQRWLAEKKVSDLPPGFVPATASNW